MGAENLKGMKQEEAQVEDCDEEEYQLDGLSMLRKKIDDVGSVTFRNIDLSLTQCFFNGYIYQEQQAKLEKEKGVDQFVNSIKKEKEGMEQTLTSQAIHITPPNNDYVAPATVPILVELPKEFDDEPLIDSLTTEDDECNLISDMEELEQVLVHDPFSTPREFIEHLETIGTIVAWNPLIHPQHGVRYSSKSLTKRGKMRREMASP
ncbi:hypothetical protein Tco_1533009 [Tanacetum coccineum]